MSVLESKVKDTFRTDVDIVSEGFTTATYN